MIGRYVRSTKKASVDHIHRERTSERFARCDLPIGPGGGHVRHGAPTHPLAFAVVYCRLLVVVVAVTTADSHPGVRTAY